MPLNKETETKIRVLLMGAAQKLVSIGAAQYPGKNRKVSDHRGRFQESEKKDKYLEISWELKTITVEYGSDGDTTCNWRVRYSHRRAGGPGNERKSGDQLC